MQEEQTHGAATRSGPCAPCVSGSRYTGSDRRRTTGRYRAPCALQCVSWFLLLEDTRTQDPDRGRIRTRNQDRTTGRFRFDRQEEQTHGAARSPCACIWPGPARLHGALCAPAYPGSRSGHRSGPRQDKDTEPGPHNRALTGGTDTRRRDTIRTRVSGQVLGAYTAPVRSCASWFLLLEDTGHGIRTAENGACARPAQDREPGRTLFFTSGPGRTIRTALAQTRAQVIVKKQFTRPHQHKSRAWGACVVTYWDTGNCTGLAQDRGEGSKPRKWPLTTVARLFTQFSAGYRGSECNTTPCSIVS